MSSSNQTSNSVLKEDPLASVLSVIDELAKGKLTYPPRITKYELARVVAARAKQLAMVRSRSLIHRNWVRMTQYL